MGRADKNDLMREVRWIQYVVLYTCTEIQKEMSLYMNKVVLGWFCCNNFLEKRRGSNGGCSFTHVNMRCLGDFAEMSRLQVGFEQMWVVEKANWNWHLIWQVGSVLTSRPQYECGKLSAAQYGNKMRRFVYLPPLFWLACRSVYVSRSSKYHSLWNWRNLFPTANLRQDILLKLRV